MGVAVVACLLACLKMATAQCISSFLIKNKPLSSQRKSESAKQRTCASSNPHSSRGWLPKKGQRGPPEGSRGGHERWPKRSRRARANSGCPSRARLVCILWSLDGFEAKAACRFGPVRLGKEATWRPKKGRIRWGLGFSERPGMSWSMLGSCWPKLGLGGFLEANPPWHLGVRSQSGLQIWAS